MNFDPEITIESALPEFAGVAFTIHQFTEGKRLKIRMALADSNARIRDLMVEKLSTDTLPEDERAASYARIISEMQELVDDKINPTWVRNLLMSVQGMTIKGQPVTPELLIDSGPRVLFQEIVKAIRKEAGLTEQERGEVAPPTTSSAQADGRMNSSSATTAENADSI